MSQDGGNMLDLPSFETPPVVEVVIAVAFERVDAIGYDIGAIHRQLFRESGKKTWEAKPPYLPPIEHFGDRAWMPEVRLEFPGAIPAPRYWFSSDSGSDLIQLQQDWIARNWRRMPKDPQYPRYQSLSEPFEDDLRKLDTYLQQNADRTFVPTQCEVTYVNHITRSGVWQDVGEVGRVSNLWGKDAGFLPTPERVQFDASYVISEDEGGEPVGRLHVSLVPALSQTDNEPILVLTMTARGAPLSPTIAGVMDFLNLGHRWIVQSFRSMATPEMLHAWKETT